MNTTFNKVSFENGANKATAKNIINGVKKDLAGRENGILNDLATVEQNKDVPSDYVVYSFYDSVGNGFEAGKTPSGYSITN